MACAIVPVSRPPRSITCAMMENALSSGVILSPVLSSSLRPAGLALACPSVNVNGTLLGGAGAQRHLLKIEFQLGYPTQFAQVFVTCGPAVDFAIILLHALQFISPVSCGHFVSFCGRLGICRLLRLGRRYSQSWRGT